MHEYDLIAEWYASERVDQTGVAEAMALVQSLPRGASVLDIGCRNGIPITRALLSAGYRIVGIDSSSEMLAPRGRDCTSAIASATPVWSTRSDAYHSAIKSDSCNFTS